MVLEEALHSGLDEHEIESLIRDELASARRSKNNQ
jgi:hypothetical protein